MMMIRKMVLCTCLFVSLLSCQEGKDIDAFNQEINASIQDYLLLHQENVVVRIVGEISKKNGGTIQCLNCNNNELEYFNSKKFISSFMKFFGNAKEDEKYRFSLRVNSVSNTYGFQLFKSDRNHDFQKEKMVFNCNGSYIIHLDKIEKPMPEIKEESYAEGHYSTFTFLNHELLVAFCGGMTTLPILSDSNFVVLNMSKIENVSRSGFNKLNGKYWREDQYSNTLSFFYANVSSQDTASFNDVLNKIGEQ